MSEDRKKDHIELAFKSVPDWQADTGNQFYEPLFSPHPDENSDISKTFLNKEMKLPLWISSMTGGTEKALTINKNLARACKEFGLGMGLGSCRPLLESSDRFDDFNMRPKMGDAPLYTNFGIAQLEELAEQNQIGRVVEISKRLEADGIIIHVNPLQEWAQPEGDKYKKPALETIQRVVDATSYPLIVKEVGQGFGPKSLKTLMNLPIQAIELAGYGGTNFTMLEQARLSGANSGKTGPRSLIGYLGHTPEEMIFWINQILAENKNTPCQEFIISGGITDPLQGYKLMGQLKTNSVFGMASEILKYSMGDYEQLEQYLLEVKDCLNIANAFLKG